MKKTFFFFVLIFVVVISWQSASAETSREWLERGINLEKQYDLNGAIAAYTKAIAIDSKYADAYFLRGKVCLSLKPTNCLDALEDFNIAIKLDSRNAEAYYERGLLNAFIINNEQAKRDMQMAARLGHIGAQEWLTPGKVQKKGKYIASRSYIITKDKPIVHFDFDCADIKQQYYSLLDKIGITLKEKYSKASIILSGHADSIGSEKYNYDLSLRRAETVKTYLVEKHKIAATCIIVKAYGKSKPITPNSSDMGRALNRRVEMTGIEIN